MAGYHVAEIKKSSLGHPDKIREEYEELVDSISQGNKIMALLELADIVGAVEGVAENLGSNLVEVLKMAAATKSAFQDGSRPYKSRFIGKMSDMQVGENFTLNEMAAVLAKVQMQKYSLKKNSEVRREGEAIMRKPFNDFVFTGFNFIPKE